MSSLQVKLPEILVPVFTPPRGSVQYRGAHGGRGSGKSFNFATVAAIWGALEPLRILCVREFMTSIKESFHAELKAAILNDEWLSEQYDIGVDTLRGKVTGTDFIFMGLRRSVNSVRSTAAIDLTIVEEAEDIPENSWLQLEATVFRRPKSELWAIWNPKLDKSPVDMRLRKQCPTDGSALIVEMNYKDNPFFPPGLEKLRVRQQQNLDPDTYNHVWNGGYLTNSNAQVYGGKWEIGNLEVDDSWNGPYHGGDFGFSNDPTAAIRCWVNGPFLYIDKEAGARKLSLDDTVDYIEKRIPGFKKHVSRWDSARPESIDHLKKKGMDRIQAAPKWQGSVEDGIAFIRSFKRIVVHPDCVNVIEELRTYSYKVDQLTGDVLPKLIDGNDHYLDALRYALADLIKSPAKFMMYLTSRAKEAA